MAVSLAGVTSGDPLAAFWNLTSIVPALAAAGVVFERWGWRWQPLHRIGLISTPVIGGTWRGRLQTTWMGADGTAPVKTVYLTVEQTATTSRACLLSDESASVQLTGGPGRTEAGHPALAYTYRNRPDPARRLAASAVNYGAAVIEIIGKPATELRGEYWTDRLTAGSLVFDGHSPRVAQTFEQAEELTYGPPHPLGVLDGLRTR